MNTVKTEDQFARCPVCGAPLPAGAPQGLCPACLLAGAAGAPTEMASTPAHHLGAPPSVEAVRAAFPHLEVLGLIGAGGMGAVFQARQPKLDRLVALKVLAEPLGKQPTFAERFHREARVLARLNHPNIVSVFDFGEAGGFFYLLMEYVDGANLRQAMRAGRFTPAQALGVVPKICEALQFAHEHGILHRDIKPENILLDAKGRVKIADFGIAKLVGGGQADVTLTASGAALGTPAYMAPEQIEKPSEVDHRADIYSLGVVFYEMLTGELPLGRFAPPSQKTPLDARVDEIVLRALAKERELRQQSAHEVKTEVEGLTAAGLRPGAGRVAAVPAAGAEPPARDFILCHPRLPRMAQAITVYAVILAPLLWLFGVLVRKTPEPLVWPYGMMVENLGWLGRFLATAALFVGGLKLRNLRPDGARLIRQAIWLYLGTLAWTLLGTLWAERAAGKPMAAATHFTTGEAALAVLAVFSLGCKIASLMWLRRNRARLDALCSPDGSQGGSRQGSAPPPTSHGSPVTNQAFASQQSVDLRGMWLALDARTRLAFKAGVIVLAILLGYAFVFYRIDWVAVGTSLVRTGNVGWGSPWLSFWRSPNQGLRLQFGLDLFTFSFTAGLAAMALVILYFWLRRAEKAAWRRTHGGGETDRPGENTGAPPASSASVVKSRRALAASVLVCASLLTGLPLALLLCAQQFHWLGTGQGGRSLIAPVLILILLTLVFALPGTLMGAMAVSEMRHAGKPRYGWPVALFAAWCWPVLCLDALVTIPILFVLDSAHAIFSPAASLLLSVALGTILTAVLTVVVARTLWSRTTASPNGPPPQPLGNRTARPAIWGAALTGLSLPVPMLFAVLAFAGAGGLGVGELWLMIACVVCLGISGTLLGWVALSQIRAGQPQVHGLPLALFAALTWPVLALLALGLLPPMMTVTLEPPSFPIRLLALAWPVGCVVGAVWLTHATTRWAAGRTGSAPTVSRKRWYLIGLALLVLIALAAWMGPSADRAGVRVGHPAAKVAEPAGARLSLQPHSPGGRLPARPGMMVSAGYRG